MPQKAKGMDLFYLRPLDSVKDDASSPWYYSSPVGERKLNSMVKEMFAAVGITGKTNHSLRATGASALFQANVPEKIIQERTGHRSVKALRLYERTTEKQHQDVSEVLSARSEVSVTSTLPSFLPLGALQNCTVNINYGPATITCNVNGSEQNELSQ